MPGRIAGLIVAAAVLIGGGCTSPPAGVEPISGFEAERYAGKWYAIKRLDHRFERGLTDVTAEYELLDDGRVRVVNRGLDPEACQWREVEGTARFQGDPEVASLTVTFFWPIRGGYHVLALDRDGYDWALVSGPTRGYLWILARESELEAGVVNELVDKASELGFNAEELIQVTHGKHECDL